MTDGMRKVLVRTNYSCAKLEDTAMGMSPDGRRKIRRQLAEAASKKWSTSTTIFLKTSGVELEHSFRTEGTVGVERLGRTWGERYQVDELHCGILETY